MFRFTANGGFTILQFGGASGVSGNSLWMFDVLSTGSAYPGTMRTWYLNNIYSGYDTALVVNTWYIMTYKYSGGLLSSATVRINGLNKTLGAVGDGTPTTALSNVWALPQFSGGGSIYYGGMYLNNTAMSLSNIEKVEGFFAHRMFSNGSMLTPSHPYYSVAPTF